MASGVGAGVTVELSGEPSFLNVAKFHVLSFTVLGSTSELGLLCGASTPATDPQGTLGLAVVPQVFLSIPPVAAKELRILLNTYIETVEAQVGELTSDFIKAHQGDA